MILPFLILSVGTSVAKNMNNISYVIANPASGAPKERQFSGEYFEFYGPVTSTRYSEVLWEDQSQQLPDEIVKRFDNRILAITGYEVDIVRTKNSSNGTVISEASVKPFEIYNHHYSGYMYSKAVHLDPSVKVSRGRGHPPPSFSRVSESPSPDGIPIVQVFSEGNGNEHRSSFHGFGSSFAQLIWSPVTWTNMPMIINTNKRLTDDKSPGPIGGPLPRSSLAPENASYSGLVECPCTTRITRVLSSYLPQFSGVCSTAVADATECASASSVLNMFPAQNVTETSQSDLPPGCSASFTDSEWQPVFNTAALGTPCGSGGSESVWKGSTHIDGASVTVGLTVDLQNALVTISLSAADGAWFGVGFNASKMSDAPYAIIINGTGDVQERRLADHAPGTVLPTSLTVQSSRVVGGIRTVVLSRALTRDFNFTTSVSLIAAGGASGEGVLAYHGTRRGAVPLLLVRAKAQLCLCRDPNANTGIIGGSLFEPNCAPPPVGELLSKHNAICNFTEYNGGLYCCHGGVFLLDADQAVPDPVDEWRLKYRFYFSDVDKLPANTFRVWWSTEAYDNEYDVPQSSSDCLDADTDPELCTYTIKSHFRGLDMVSGPSACMVQHDANACGNTTRIQEDGGFYQLVYAAGHCHAPACLSLELWDDDKGVLLCQNSPVFGEEDTKGYISAIPPCVWGSADEGLLDPVVIHLNSNLTTITRANSTYGHWGVMGLWQMRAAYMS